MKLRFDEICVHVPDGIEQMVRDQDPSPVVEWLVKPGAGPEAATIEVGAQF